MTLHFALRPQKRGGLLGTGTVGGGGGGGGGGEDQRVKTRSRIPPEEDWRNRGPPPRTMEVLRRCPIAIAHCCFNCRAGQSHKDNVRCTADEERPEAKEVQLSQHSSTSLLMISSGLT